MEKKVPLSKKLTGGIFYLLSSSIVSLGLNVITVAVVARSLGVENFGLYSLILSFVQLFQFLTDFGLNRTLLKFGSTDINKAQISFGNALYLKTILALPTFFLLTFFALLAGYRNEELIVLEFFAIGLILESYATIFSSIRRILGSFKLISFFRVIKTIVNLIIVIIALQINNSVLSLAIANALLSIIIFIISLVNTILLLKPKLRLSLIKEFFKDSVIFSFSDFFLNIYARISTVLLSFFSDLHSVGIFSAALRFTRIANLLPTQIRFALLPTLYRILEDRTKNNEKRVFLIIFKYMVILATPITIAIYFFSEEIIHLIFGRKYDASISLVELFSVFIFLRFIQTPFSLFYVAMNEHKNLVYFQGFTSTINIILNLTLIPVFSASGACFATLISEAFFSLILVIAGKKYLVWELNDVFKILFKSIVAIFLGVYFVLIFLSKVHVIFQMIILLISYLFFLYILKMFNKSDKELFLKVFTNK